MDKLAPPRAVVFDATAPSSTCTASGCWPSSCSRPGDALARLWRDKQIDYTRLVSMSGRYQPFWDLTRAGLRFARSASGCRSTRRPRSG
jgi:2-haloacid dehalogenase